MQIIKHKHTHTALHCADWPPVHERWGNVAQPASMACTTDQTINQCLNEHACCAQCVCVCECRWASWQKSAQSNTTPSNTTLLVRTQQQWFHGSSPLLSTRNKHCDCLQTFCWVLLRPQLPAACYCTALKCLAQGHLKGFHTRLKNHVFNWTVPLSFAKCHRC